MMHFVLCNVTTIQYLQLTGHNIMNHIAKKTDTTIYIYRYESILNKTRSNER